MTDDLIGLQEYFERLTDERDKRYEERFQAQEKAVQMALAAQNRMITIALAGVPILLFLVARLMK